MTDTSERQIILTRVLEAPHEVFASTAQRDKTIDFGAIEGGKQTFDRLQAHLAGEESPCS